MSKKNFKDVPACLPGCLNERKSNY